MTRVKTRSSRRTGPSDKKMKVLEIPYTFDLRIVYTNRDKETGEMNAMTSRRLHGTVYGTPGRNDMT